MLDEQAETLVAASHDGVLRALDPESGDLRWAFRPDSAFGASIGGRHYQSTPALLPGGLVAAADDKGTVVALDLATGRLAWSVEMGAAVTADLVAASGELFVSTERGLLLALGEGGAERWRYQAAPMVKLASVSVGLDLVAVGGTDGVLRGLDPETGQVRWTFTTDGAITSAPAVASGGGRGVVYVGGMDRRVVGLDAQTGEVAWEAEVEGRVKTTPVVTPGGVLFFREPSEVMMFRNAVLAAN